ncbi:MAG: fused MFS/spermidine synthase [Candidatus Aminicenantes bacterium]|nr:fused MFS/spermidine synthase [Candidatus Aminicenantes bacterium]
MKKHVPPFLLGFLALSFQIFLIREFSVHFYGNEITIGFILASWLLWGGLGSICGSKIRWDALRFPHAYYLVILLFPICLVLLRFSRFLLHILPGEITGITPMLIHSLVLSFFISFPLGVIFVFNVHFLKGNLTQVYLLESLGSAIAGLAIYFFFIPFLSNWQAAAVVGASVAFLVFLFLGHKKQLILILLIFLALSAFWLFDFPSQKIHWKPFDLIQSRDTPFGKLQVIRTEEQLSLYNNSLLIYSHPDLASSEESIHFALLQKSEAQTVLLIGGGAGGSLKQVLKFPVIRVDYVELDPEIIHLSLKYLPKQEKKSFEDQRVHMFFQDGRAFLKKTLNTYDIIIINLPEPSTAQINRFYTKEFFHLVKSKLTSRGIFSFRVSSAENYISSELQNFLASLYYTLKDVFPTVEIVPGDSNIFLASTGQLSLDHQELTQEIERLDLKNVYVSGHSLFSRLSSYRIEFLKEKVLTGKKVINRDLVPISYFYNSVLWSTQFQSFETVLFHFFSKISRFWLIDLPLIVFVAFLILLGVRRKKTSFFLIPLAVMGLTTLTIEIVVLIAFQTSYGYLYQKVALLFACFMIGLFLGALRGKMRKTKAYLHILLIQTGFILLLFLLLLWLESQLPEFFFFLFLLLLCYLGGDMFIVSNHLYLEVKKNFGLGYGLDLLGSFFGALVASSLLIPLFGLPLLAKYIFLLNSFCLVFLLWGFKAR